MLNLKKLITGFVFVITFIVSASFCVALEKDTDYITIGCYEDNKFLCENNYGVYEGYLPDYINELERIMNSQLEYEKNYKFDFVFGSKKELKKLLDNDEIDLMVGNVEMKSELKDNVIMTSEFLNMPLVLSAKIYDDNCFFRDFHFINNYNIGYYEEGLEKNLKLYTKNSGYNCELVKYKSKEDLNRAFDLKKVDLVAAPAYETFYNEKIIDYIGIAKLCFFMNKNNGDAYKIVEAMEYVDVIDMSLKSKLIDKYLDVNNTMLSFTREENNLLNSEEPLIFAVNYNEKLVTYNKAEEKYEGPYISMIEFLAEKWNFNYKIIRVYSIEEGLEKEADVFLGMIEQDDCRREYNIEFTRPYLRNYNSYWKLKGSSIKNEDDIRLGIINVSQSLAKYFKIRYPKVDIVNYYSDAEAVNALKAGEIDIIMTDKVTSGDFDYDEIKECLTCTSLPKIDLSMGINLNKKNARTIESTLNKLIFTNGSEKVGEVIYNNLLLNLSLKEVLDLNYNNITTCIHVLLMLLVGLFLWHYFALKKSAYFNSELKIWNRNYIMKRGYKYCNSNSTLLNIDIAKFKQINMIWGIKVGDEVRKFVIDKLKEYKGCNLSIFETSGLNLLCILSSDNNEENEETEKFINYIFDDIGIFKYNDVDIALDYHIGVYTYQEDDNFYNVLTRIEMSTILAKKRNKSVQYFDVSLEEDEKRESVIESKMEEALEKGHFKVYLQQQTRVSDESISGAEMLVRWVEDDGNIICPDDFISIFEKNGFIEKLDMYMFEKACKIQKKLCEKGKDPIKLSVNQSRYTLSKNDYCERIDEIVKRYGTITNLIEVEVTEYEYGNFEKVVYNLEKLKNRNFSIAIDDFGCGFSSLNMLGNKNFDCVKLDKDFLRVQGLSESNKKLIASIVEMNHALGVACICEGVETLDEVEYLRTIDCEYIQGYYYSKPLPCKTFIELVYGFNCDE